MTLVSSISSVGVKYNGTKETVEAIIAGGTHSPEVISNLVNGLQGNEIAATFDAIECIDSLATVLGKSNPAVGLGANLYRPLWGRIFIKCQSKAILDQ